MYVPPYLRQSLIDDKVNIEATKKPRTKNRGGKAVPAPEANAELQVNLDVSSSSKLLKILMHYMPPKLLIQHLV